MSLSRPAERVFTNSSMLANNAQQTAENAQKVAQQALKDGTGNIVNFGSENPNKAGIKNVKKGDIYFQTSGGVQTLWYFNGRVWVKSVDSATGQEIATKVQQDVENNKKAVDAVNNKMNSINSEITLRKKINEVLLNKNYIEGSARPYDAQKLPSSCFLNLPNASNTYQVTPFNGNQQIVLIDKSDGGNGTNITIQPHVKPRKGELWVLSFNYMSTYVPTVNKMDLNITMRDGKDGGNAGTWTVDPTAFDIHSGDDASTYYPLSFNFLIDNDFINDAYITIDEFQHEIIWDGYGHKKLPLKISIDSLKFERKVDGDTDSTEWTPAPSDFANNLYTSKDLMNSTIKGMDATSEITQTDDMINLRVEKGTVINQINVDDSGVLISGEKVHITGKTVIDNAVIGDASIKDLSASKLTAGVIDASKITVINLDAGNITTGTLNGNVVNVTNLNASNITGGTLSGVNLDISGEANLNTNGGNVDQRSSNTFYNPWWWRSSNIKIKNAFIQCYADDVIPPQYGGNNTPAHYAQGTYSPAYVKLTNWDKNPGEQEDTNNGASLIARTYIDAYGLATTGTLDTGNITVGSAHTFYSNDNGQFYFKGANDSRWVAVNAQKFNSHSELSSKTNVKQINPVKAVNLVKSVDIMNYNFKDDLDSGIKDTQASLVIDDVNKKPKYSAPVEFLGDDGKSRDDGKLVGYLTKVVQKLLDINSEIQARLGLLEAKQNEQSSSK